MTWKGALLVSVGPPDVVSNVVMDAMENIVKVIAAAGALFCEDVPKQSALERTNQILNGPAPALGPIPRPRRVRCDGCGPGRFGIGFPHDHLPRPPSP